MGVRAGWKAPWHLGTWEVLERKTCSLQRVLAFGVGEGRLVRGSKYVRVQVSLVRVKCLKGL